VWDKNPYAIPTAQVKDLRCELTLLAGQVVFRRAPAAVK
jgi:predicted amidohydrolase YtcJ